MFLFIQLIYCQNYDFNSKGYYSVKATSNDTLTFNLQNEERAYVFASSNLKNCLQISNINIPFPSDLTKSISFDSPSCTILILQTVNISIWIADKNICTPSSIFVTSEFEYSLNIQTNFSNPYQSFCIFSPSHITDAFRRIEITETDKKADSDFSTIQIYLVNPDKPLYEYQTGVVGAAICFPYFTRIIVPEQIRSYQILLKSYEDSKFKDDSFGSDLASISFYMSESGFVNDSDWISSFSASFTDPPLKTFPWVWAIIIILSMIILILVILFAFCMRLRNNQLNALASSCSEDDSCVPDAQQMNQASDTTDNEHDIVQYPDNDKPSSDPEDMHVKEESKDVAVTIDKMYDNPYEHDPLSFNEAEIQNTDEEINPYSLPKP